MNINYGKQSIDEKDIKSVVKTLRSNYLSQGPQVNIFENKFKNYLGAKYCCAVSNGTGALFLSGLALGWKKNDVVITSPITFLASANCILYNNATPDFVDINSKDYTIDLNLLEEKIQSYKKINKKIKAVIGIDFAGHPCDWKGLRYLADKYNFHLVNDNCHALGSSINNNKKYAIKYADLVTHSFHPVKNITTGEGGAIITNSKKIHSQLINLRTHGIIKDRKKLNRYDGPWYYEMHELGYNFRITDFQCALGTSQLKKIDKFIKTRKKIANFYNKSFSNKEDIITPIVKKGIGHAYHLYILQFNFRNTKIDKIKFFHKMKSKGINLMVHYIPIIMQPYYKKKYKFKNNQFPESIKYYDRAFSLPIYPDLKHEEMEFVVEETIKNFV